MGGSLYCLTCFFLWCGWNSGPLGWCHRQSEWPAFKTISRVAKPRRCEVSDTSRTEPWSMIVVWDSLGVLSTRPGLLEISSSLSFLLPFSSLSYSSFFWYSWLLFFLYVGCFVFESYFYFWTYVFVLDFSFWSSCVFFTPNEDIVRF